MKTILTLALTLQLLTSFSQCKFEKNQIDEFTGKRIVETKYLRVAGTFTSTLAMKMRLVGDSPLLDVVCNPGTGTFMIIEKNASLMIKLVNGETLTLKTINGSYSERLSNASVIYATYELEQAVLDKISSIELQKIRVYLTDGFTEFEATKKGPIQFVSLSKCFKNIL